MCLKARDMYVKDVDNPWFENEYESSWLNRSRKVKIRFIDSHNFMNASLSKLVSNLAKENSPFFSFVRDAFPVMINQPMRDCTDEDMKYLVGKMDFPYSYLTSPEVLQPYHPIPPRHFFDNDLTGEKMTDSDWIKFNEICQRFNISDFPSLVRLYTCLDTVLLAVVWESFRSDCISIYSLDPTYQMTLSSYAWNAWLFTSRCSVDYIRDKDMLNMITDGIRGGKINQYIRMNGKNVYNFLRSLLCNKEGCKS